MKTVDFNRRKKAFRRWLQERGAELLDPTDKKRDLLRFAANGKVALVHRGPGDRLIMMHGAEEAWAAYLAKGEWSSGREAPAAKGKPARRAPRKTATTQTRWKVLRLGRSGRVEVPGLYAMAAEEHHADPAPEPSLSSSGARLIERSCPMVYWRRRLDPPAPTKAQQLGAAAHQWLLEGETWEQRYDVLSPFHNGRTSLGKATEETIRARGRVPLPYRDYAAIQAMRDALEADPWAMSAFRGGVAEQSIFWRDALTGAWCRTRIDYLPLTGSIITEYKTCVSAHPHDVDADIRRFGYRQQAEWIIRGVRTLGIIAEPQVVFVFQEKEAPHAVYVATLTEEALVEGRMKNDRSLARFVRGLRTGQWPGYADDIAEHGLTDWERARIQRDSERGLYDLAAILEGVPLDPPAPDAAADERAAEIAATP